MGILATETVVKIFLVGKEAAFSSNSIMSYITDTHR